MTPRAAAGATLVELMMVVGGALALCSMAAPLFRGQEDDRTVRGAARHLAAVLQRQRTEAIARSASTALRFQTSSAGTPYAVFVDGNGNGVRTTEINRGVDPQVSPWERIDDQFPGVTFGIAPAVLDMDTGESLAGDPVRTGGTDLLAFSPTGTATSATLYLRGRSGAQWAVRVLGVTGRIRVLRYDREGRQWLTP